MHDEADTTLTQVHERLVNTLLVLATVAALPQFVLSVLSLETSWDGALHVAHVLSYMVLFVTMLARTRLSLAQRAYVAIGLIVVESMALLLTGDEAGIVTALLCFGVLFAGQIFGRRAGLLVLGLGLVLLGAAAAADLIGLYPNVSSSPPAHAASTWMYKLGMYGLLGSAVHVMQVRISNALQATVEHMRQRRAALGALNEALEASYDDLQASRDALAQASEAKDRLVANLSHQLRTPLSGIIGFSALIPEAVDDEDRTTHIESLRRSALDLDEMVDRLLSVANPDHDRQSEQLVETDSREMLEDVASAVRDKLKDRGIQFQLRVDAEVPETLLTERANLIAALEQLVDNAERYTDSGRVSVTATADDDERALIVEIADTGMGIPQDELERLWEPFEQLTIGSEGRGGSGLGLSIARSRIEEIGGRIDLDSSVGSGTRVRVSVPYLLSADEDGAVGAQLSVHQTGSFPTMVSSGVLTRALRERIARAAENGDFFCLCELLDDVRAQSEQAAGQVKKYVDAYDYIALEKWLASGNSADSGSPPL